MAPRRAQRFAASMKMRAPAIAPGTSGETMTRLFAGAKQVAIVDGYDNTLGVDRLELLIDWGWFYFITKPLFWLMDYFFKLFGNLGVAILIVTVIIKIVFFPLANKSYASMAKMKAVQPQMMAIRERYADDPGRVQRMGDQAAHPGPAVHPHLRAPRRQRGDPLAVHALVPGAIVAV